MTAHTTAPAIDLGRPLVVGFGVTGRAVVAALVSRGASPLVIEDRPTRETRRLALDAGIELVEAPDQSTVPSLSELVTQSSIVLPSPGVPDAHPVFAAAATIGRPVASEFDLARMWDDRPIVAITGTNGKTTVTAMVADALQRSGISVAAAGNTETPLVTAIDDPAVEVFVVEASSFRLGHSRVFSPQVATWLNFAPDHLDAHRSLEAYEEAKAAIWRDLPAGSVAIANCEDSVVERHRPTNTAVVTFGVDDGDWCRRGDWLVGPDGPLLAIERLPIRRPHDVANAAAAAATAVAAGATADAVVGMLESFAGLPHRLQLVGRWNDVEWYNDSKATVPGATMAAATGFDSVVLLAGGRNKGLDLSVLGSIVPPVRSVVAFGEARADIRRAFEPHVPVVDAASMAAAIDQAAEQAEPGDAVLLSPACTSFDSYASYAERGCDFVRLVTEKFDQRGQNQ